MPGAIPAGFLSGDLATAGTPSNLGKIDSAGGIERHRYSYLTSSSALADTDPLGANQNVTFDEVGGLDDRMRFLSF